MVICCGETSAFGEEARLPDPGNQWIHDLTDIGDREVSLRLVAAQRPNRAMTIMHERYRPKADTGSDMLSHKGEEGGIVVAGRVELTVGAQSRVLEPGDAYYFTSAVPHRFRNFGDEPCEIISACTPPTF